MTTFSFACRDYIVFQILIITQSLIMFFTITMSQAFKPAKWSHFKDSDFSDALKIVQELHAPKSITCFSPIKLYCSFYVRQHFIQHNIRSTSIENMNF